MTSEPMDTPTPLIDRLLACANLWVESTDGSLARLGRVVVNDGGYFERLGRPGASTTTATLEKFARYLYSPQNWPDGIIPEEAATLATILGVSGSEVPGSSDTDGAVIGEVDTSTETDPEEDFPLQASGEASVAPATARAGAAEDFQLTNPAVGA